MGGTLNEWQCLARKLLAQQVIVEKKAAILPQGSAKKQKLEAQTQFLADAQIQVADIIQRSAYADWAIESFTAQIDRAQDALNEN